MSRFWAGLSHLCIRYTVFLRRHFAGAAQTLAVFGDLNSDAANPDTDTDTAAPWQVKLLTATAVVWIGWDPPVHFMAAKKMAVGHGGGGTLWWARATDGASVQTMVRLLLVPGGPDLLVVDAACFFSSAHLSRQWPAWVRAARRQGCSIMVGITDSSQSSHEPDDLRLAAYPPG